MFLPSIFLLVIIFARSETNIDNRAANTHPYTLLFTPFTVKTTQIDLKRKEMAKGISFP